MASRNFDKLKQITIGKGGDLFRVKIWRTKDGWHYDGPASSGPKHVRESGRGPHWCGPVDEKYVKDVLRRCEAKGIAVEEEFDD